MAPKHVYYCLGGFFLQLFSPNSFTSWKNSFASYQLLELQLQKLVRGHGTRSWEESWDGTDVTRTEARATGAESGPCSLYRYNDRDRQKLEIMITEEGKRKRKPEGNKFSLF